MKEVGFRRRAGDQRVADDLPEPTRRPHAGGRRPDPLVARGALRGRATLPQFLRYLLSGGAAVVTHLAVLVALVELAGIASTLASALGFACAVPVNYGLQHRFVFGKSSQHFRFFTRYVGITLLTLAVNSGLFWVLTVMLGIFYLASQVITLGIVVPLNYVVNRRFTFADAADGRWPAAVDGASVRDRI